MFNTGRYAALCYSYVGNQVDGVLVIDYQGNLPVNRLTLQSPTQNNF